MANAKVSFVRSYRDLVAWQKAMALVTNVYRYTESFPKAEIYGLSGQLRRAAVSIPSNIAEGQGRASTGEFKQFLGQRTRFIAGSRNPVADRGEPGLSPVGTVLASSRRLLRAGQSLEWSYRLALTKSIMGARCDEYCTLVTDH
jgi:hypothetical protein